MIALLRRDLMLAFRAGGGFGLGLAFFLIVTVLVPFSVGPQSELLSTIAPGVLWLGALLACLLSLDRLLALDFEDGTLDLLATAPLPLEAALRIKALSHWLTTGLPLVMAAPILGLMLNLEPDGYLWLISSLALGTPALSGDRHLWRGAHGGDQTRWVVDVAAGVAAVRSHVDIRGRSRTSRGDGAGWHDAADPAGGHHTGHNCVDAFRIGCGAADDIAVSSASPEAFCPLSAS